MLPALYNQYKTEGFPSNINPDGGVHFPKPDFRVNTNIIQDAIKKIYGVLEERSFLINNKQDFLSNQWFNNDGEMITLVSKRVLLTVSDFNRSYGETIIEVFHNGKFIPESSGNYDLKRALGDVRIFYKEYLVNNGDIFIVKTRKKLNNYSTRKNINMIYDNDQDAEIKSQVYASGIDRVDSRDYVPFIKRESLTNYKEVSSQFYSNTIESNYNMTTYIDGIQLNDGDKLLIQNKYSYYNIDETLITENTFETKTTKILNTLEIPLPIWDSKELEIYADGNRLIPGKHYEVIKNRMFQDAQPKIQFLGTLPANTNIFIRKNSTFDFESSLYHFQEVIPDHGLIRLETSFPLNNEYVDVYVKNELVPKENIEIIGHNIVKISGVNSLKDLMITANVPQEGVLKEMTDWYEQNKSSLAEYYDETQFQTYLDDYLLTSPELLIDTAGPSYYFTNDICTDYVLELLALNKITKTDANIDYPLLEYTNDVYNINSNNDTLSLEGFNEEDYYIDCNIKEGY
jgi:hypothetical protein